MSNEYQGSLASEIFCQAISIWERYGSRQTYHRELGDGKTKDARSANQRQYAREPVKERTRIQIRQYNTDRYEAQRLEKQTSGLETQRTIRDPMRIQKWDAPHYERQIRGNDKYKTHETIRRIGTWSRLTEQRGPRWRVHH